MYKVSAVILIALLQNAICKDNGKVYIADINLCRGHNYTIVADRRLKNHTDGQLLKYRLTLKEDLDSDNSYSCKIFAKLGEKNYKQVMHLHGKGACGALNKYGGKFFRDLEVKANIPTPGTCPINAKVYFVDWFKINYKDIPFLALIPKGQYNAECKLLDINERVIKACLQLQVVRL